MICPKCRFDCPAEFGFCPKCGTPLQQVCPNCGWQLPAEFAFCPKCGCELAAAAVSAEHDTQAILRSAVQRLVPKEYAERLLATRGQPHDERRTVSILFSDVRGSTAMAEKLDPEDVKEIMHGVFEFLIPPIYRYEGTLAQVMGDAILAFFGAPIAHEDDPERACRAALEITAEAQRYAEKLEVERGIGGFNVRVGINTGLVVMGELGSDLRVEYTAVGDAINLAARMESAAEPGTVLITEATHKLIAPLFESESLGRIEVKGKAEPVAVYRVLAAKEVAGKTRGIAGLESPLVGREAELAALREALDRLTAGVGGIVTIVGDAGIGKSRLVAEVRSHAHVIASPCPGEAIPPPQQGGDCSSAADADAGVGGKMPRNDLQVRWVEGRCLSYGTTVPYLLWLDVLRRLLDVTLQDSPAVLRDSLRQRIADLCPDRFDDVDPYLARLMSLRPEPVEGLPLGEEIRSKLDDLDAEVLRARTFQAVEALLENAAKRQPLVVVCEDLHWADPTSLQLLEWLLPLTQRAPLLLICILRPVKEHPSWQFCATLTQIRADRHTALTLEPLSLADSQTLVSNLLRVESLPEILRERILSRAEGNPFFVEEVIRSLIDRGVIARDQASGGWAASGEVATIPIPDTLQGVLMARIDRLQEDTKRVLQLAAVVGRIFLYRVLAAIAEEERRLDEHLLTLQVEEMIRERARLPELEYIFKHDLTREAAYNGLLKKERRVYHRQVAEALERLFPERVEEQLGLLAYHWEGAQDAEKAPEYLLRAGDQARLAFSHQEAIDYYQRALPFLRQEGQYPRAARTWMKLGLTYHTAHDLRRSQQAYEQGFVLWERAREALHAGAAVLGPAPHAFRLAMPAPRTLDPVEAVRLGTWGVIALLFSALVEMGPRGDVVPDMARRWEVLDGGRSYVFHLREDVRWTDGVPVTAADFEYAVRRSLDPRHGADSAALLYDIIGAKAFQYGELSDWAAVGVRCADERTLVMELERPVGYFLQLLPLLTYPLPRHTVGAWGDQWTALAHLVTNGPFRLQFWEPGQMMVFHRNPDYHGLSSGNVQQLEMHLIADRSELRAMLARYADDRLDVTLVSGLSAEERQRALQRHADDYVSWWVPGVDALLFAASRAPFADRRVRQAFAMAVDRETLGGLLGLRPTSPARGGLVPAGMPGHVAGIALPYDPDRARALLAEAGFPGGRGFPKVEGLAWEEVEPWAQHLQTQWQENLDIRVSWQILPFRTFSQLLQREAWDMTFYGFHADYYDPDSFLRTGSLRKLSGWTNSGYEQLVNGARETLDEANRMALYQEADRILVKEAAIVPLAYSRSEVLCKPWVRHPVASGHLFWPPWKEFVIVPH